MADSAMVSKNLFICFAKSPVLLTLAVFVFAYNCAIVWGAESLRLGFSGATATQLAGSIAVEQKLAETVRPLRRECGTNPIRRHNHDSRFGFGELGCRHRRRRTGTERLPQGCRRSDHWRARQSGPL